MKSGHFKYFNNDIALLPYTLQSKCECPFVQVEDFFYDLQPCFSHHSVLFPSNSRFKPSARPKEINHIYRTNMITHNVTLRFPYHDEASQSSAERAIGWTPLILVKYRVPGARKVTIFSRLSGSFTCKT